MATTDYGVNHPLAVKRWAPDLMKEALKKTSYMQFMGRSSNSLCQIKTELNKAAGDRVRFGIRYQLQGDGVVGDDTLEGNEEALLTYSDNVFINQSRHAVRSEGKMSEQRVPFSVRAEARDGLADWWAEKMDTAFFTQLAGDTSQTHATLQGHNTVNAPDSDHWIYAGSQATEASLSTVDTFDLTLIDWAVEVAKTAKVPVRPIDLGRGMKRYVMFLHPYQVTAMRTTTSTGQWLDIQKAAMNGGQVTGNPIFTGALGEYNGVVLHENTRVPTVTSNTRRAIFAGAQACAVAFGQGSGGSQAFSWKEELFDYENQLGVAAGAIWGTKKCTFNSSDIGSIVVSTYAAASA